ncbi:MAG: hypothetical protein M1405_01900 [Patescibacteria group bacterium]|nr:hypothetical protein [Patescibacteria group bacterium]
MAELESGLGLGAEDIRRIRAFHVDNTALDLGNPVFEEAHLLSADTTGADPASSPDTTLHPGRPVTLSSSD